MRRVVIAALVVAVAAIAVTVAVGTSAGDRQAATGYKVRAIFDSAFAVIAGEDVKVAGVKVGKVDSLDVTPDNKAAVVLDIADPGFQDFRADASCTIRPQSLIGERFVECTPTQPRMAGQPMPPPLPKVPKGRPGAGQYLVSVAHTTHPVDLDLLNNIMRLPYRQRLSIIVSELGAGLAGQGQQLNAAIRRSSPALGELDKVLRILASQNRTLANLARDSDASLTPLAARRRQVASFIVNAGDVAAASAERRAGIEAQLKRFPAFLRQLTPTMVRLGGLSDQAAPVFEDLGAEAPALTRFIRQLGPFSQAGIPALKSLGDAADVGRVALPKTTPILKEIRALAAVARPVAADLRGTLESFRDTGGIERLMDYAFFQVAAINGFDTVGHYLRAGLLVNTCSQYATDTQGGCSAHFSDPVGTAAKAPTQAQLARYRARLAREARANRAAARRPSARTRSTPAASPSAGAAGGAPTATAAPSPGAAGTSSSSDAQSSLLDYLLGGGT